MEENTSGQGFAPVKLHQAHFRIGVWRFLCVLVWNEAVPYTETARLVCSIGDSFADAFRFVRGLQCGDPIPHGN